MHSPPTAAHTLPLPKIRAHFGINEIRINAEHQTRITELHALARSMIDDNLDWAGSKANVGEVDEFRQSGIDLHFTH